MATITRTLLFQTQSQHRIGSHIRPTMTTAQLLLIFTQGPSSLQSGGGESSQAYVLSFRAVSFVTHSGLESNKVPSGSQNMESGALEICLVPYSAVA